MHPTTLASASKKPCVTENEIRAWAAELTLSKNALGHILDMNDSEPVRIVGGTRSVRGNFPSSIIEKTLQFESHTGELVFLWLAHYWWKCRLILDQPCKLRIEYKKANGVNGAFDYPPDFFWIGDAPSDFNCGAAREKNTKFRAEFVECKRYERDLEWAIDVENNPAAQPWRYQRLSSGVWTSPPAETAAGKLGLGFRIFIAERSPPVLINNLEFLADYLEEPGENFDKRVESQIHATVEAQPGIQLRAILAGLADGKSDTLYFMVTHRAVYVDLVTEPLLPNYTARVFRKQSQCAAQRLLEQATAMPSSDQDAVPELLVRAGEEVEIDGQLRAMASVVGDVVTLSGGDHRETMTIDELERRFTRGELKPGRANALSTAQARLHFWGKIEAEEWDVMLARLDEIEPFLHASRGSKDFPAKKSRTHFRDVRKFRDAEEQYGPGFGILGLRPKARGGNRRQKLDWRAEKILNEVLDTCYASKSGPSVEFVFGECNRRCAARTPPISAPTRATIYKRIKTRDLEKDTHAREGPRASYEFSGPYWDDKWNGLSIDGEHCWSVAHIDHTQIDIATPPSPDGLTLGRPWITVMVSPKHRRVLALSISYEPPSYRSCMAVIRECVERHHRLPRIIVVDGGKEFESRYFGQLLARFKIIKKVRLAAKPRFGSVLERINGNITSRLLHNLPGNTKLTKRVRILTKEYDPERLAIWPLWDLREIITEYCYEWLDQLPDKLTGNTPRDSFAKDFRLGGPRSHKIILPNRDFLMLTMPSTKTGRVRVRRREGAVVNRIPYWCRQFREPRHVGKKFAVRYDPNDFSRIFVHIDGEWIECRCRRFQKAFLGLSEPEIRNATTELRGAASTLSEKRRATTATALASFFFARGLTPKARQIQARAAANRRSANKNRGSRRPNSRPQTLRAPDGTKLDGKHLSGPGASTALPKRKPKSYVTRMVIRRNVFDEGSHDDQ